MIMYVVGHAQDGQKFVLLAQALATNQGDETMIATITSSGDAERALQRIYALSPRDLKRTFADLVHASAGVDRRDVTTRCDDPLLVICAPREGSNEDCGRGNWWLHSSVCLTSDGQLAEVRARGSWRNYGHPSGTRYEYESGELRRLTLTPELWDRVLTSVREQLARHAEGRKRVSADARRLLASLAP